MTKFSNVWKRRWLPFALAALLSAGGGIEAQQRKGGAGRRASTTNAAKSTTAAVLERNVRAHMEFLASDAMQGRGSGTQFELLAGLYIASQLRQFGIEPAGDAADAAGA